jgi:hypothetical protein
MPVIANYFLRRSTSQLLTMRAIALVILTLSLNDQYFGSRQSSASRANFCKLAGGSRCFRI